MPGRTRSQHRCRHPPAAWRCQLPGTGARSVPRTCHRCHFPWHGTRRRPPERSCGVTRQIIGRSLSGLLAGAPIHCVVPGHSPARGRFGPAPGPPTCRFGAKNRAQVPGSPARQHRGPAPPLTPHRRWPAGRRKARQRSITCSKNGQLSRARQVGSNDLGTVTFLAQLQAAACRRRWQHHRAADRTDPWERRDKPAWRRRWKSSTSKE